jgi:hypothetical protein
MLTPGWWVLLEGQEADLRELAMHFGRSDLTVVEEPDGYTYLGSSDLNRSTSPDDARARGAELLGLARGAIEAEVGYLGPVRVAAAVRVDETGAKAAPVFPVSASFRTSWNVHGTAERTRADGMIEVVEIEPLPPRADELVTLARKNDDVSDVLAILGRDELRWADLYHVYEIVKADAGTRRFSDGWVAKTELRRFKHTADSREVIGREARHGHRKHDPPRRPMPHADARKLVRSLVKRWLATKLPPLEPRVVRVLEVRAALDEPTPCGTPTLTQEETDGT